MSVQISERLGKLETPNIFSVYMNAFSNLFHKLYPENEKADRF